MNVRENQNRKVLDTLFTTVMRTIDYVGFKNQDQSLFTNISKDGGTRDENQKLKEEVVAAIISKQLRKKFSI